MSEKFSSGTINSKQTNKKITVNKTWKKYSWKMGRQVCANEWPCLSPIGDYSLKRWRKKTLANYKQKLFSKAYFHWTLFTESLVNGVSIFFQIKERPHPWPMVIIRFFLRIKSPISMKYPSWLNNQFKFIFKGIWFYSNF